MKRRAIPFLLFALLFATGASAQNAYDALITKHAVANAVPESLVRRVIGIESRGNPNVVSKGNYGLMQIRLGTARGLGYAGAAEGLLDPDTNLSFAVKYLAGAYRAAGCDDNRAIAYYQRGYHGVPKLECHSSQRRKSGRKDREVETVGAAQPLEKIKPEGTAAQQLMKPANGQNVQALGSTPRKRANVKKDAGAPFDLLSHLKKMIAPETAKQPARKRKLPEKL